MINDERNSKDYDADVEDRGDYWRVTLINKKTGSPKTFVNVEKTEFPSKQSAITYLTKRYETQTRKKKNSSTKIKRVSEKHEKKRK